MFRELTRINQKLSDEESIEILIDAKRGILAVSGEDGYPYAMPINHYYCEEDGKIYFHGGKAGFGAAGAAVPGRRLYGDFTAYGGIWQDKGRKAHNGAVF